MRVDTLVLATSAWAKFAQYGAKFSELYSAALRDAGMLCLAIYRRIEDTDSEEDEATGDTEATEKVRRHLKVELGKTQEEKGRSFVCFVAHCQTSESI